MIFIRRQFVQVSSSDLGISRHWLLLVICPYQRTGYILDSIKKSGNPTDSYKVIKHVEKAVEMFNEDFETSHPMTWTIADCNQQSSNWECGYYVLKWCVNLSCIGNMHSRITFGMI
ncbi:unnamed protein product [Lactuca virosa]|uniref:Ubiquitin-like protease family profile domain-containing protein n=1 Tax=Lactuca virosa TaxID=75947 RepID=A0AAU9N245_9ASTR|nr:unnamed protein product [Lactuca virosa]